MPWNLKKITDKEQIFTFLMRDRLYAAYAIGDLSPNLFEETAWFGAERNGRLYSLIMLFKGVTLPVLFVMGDRDGVRVILEQDLGPEPVYINCLSEHIPVMQKIYQWPEPISMWRMVLDRELFRPSTGRCIRLTAGHGEMLETLYKQGKMAGFTKGQMENGIFYGVFEGGRLAAAAGTHLVSVFYNVAAVGNVYTSPDQRGHGHGTAVTNAVCSELISLGIRDIVLNVGQANRSAVYVYEKIGFQPCRSFFEGMASLRRFTTNK